MCCLQNFPLYVCNIFACLHQLLSYSDSQGTSKNWELEVATFMYALEQYIYNLLLSTSWRFPNPPFYFFFQSLLLNFISSFAVYQKIKTVNTKSSAKLTHHLSFQAFLKRQTSSGYNFLFQQLTSLIWLCLVLSIDARVHSWASSCD